MLKNSKEHFLIYLICHLKKKGKVTFANLKDIMRGHK